MEIKPPSLNVPLERKENWALLLVGACFGVTGLVALFSPPFATVFAASSVVGLPVLLLFVLPSPISARLHAWGDLGRLIGFAMFLGYIALAKKVLLPLLISVIEHALS